MLKTIGGQFLQFAQKNRRHLLDLFEAKIKVIHKKKIGGYSI